MRDESILRRFARTFVLGAWQESSHRREWSASKARRKASIRADFCRFERAHGMQIVLSGTVRESSMRSLEP